MQHMRKMFLGFLAVLLLRSSIHAFAVEDFATRHATSLPQQEERAVASYRMDVRLDPTAKTIVGTERISYRNPSPDILSEIWLRLYLRAFRDPNTIWMQEASVSARGRARDPMTRGDIQISKLGLANGTSLLESTTLSDTLMHVPLPQPLAPGQSIELDIEWTSKLPRVFARTGYGGNNDTFFMVGQWYPKMVVYDRGRWNTEPWHTNAEFFHDFGSYDISITVPDAYIVAGAGMPLGEQPGDRGSKRWRFMADNVTDFAFAASPDFKIRTTMADSVEIALYYLPEHAADIEEYLKAAVGSLQAFGSWYGPYPYPRLTIVDVPDTAIEAGGMEYPTLITGGNRVLPGASGAIALVTAHEIGHQWWPMQTATNEGSEPWLDEGLTEYSGMRYMLESGTQLELGGLGLDASAFDQGGYAAFTDRPATLAAWEYDSNDYITVYCKPAMGLWTLEYVVGTERFRKAMSDYLQQYRFTHPTAADFRASLERSLGPLGWFFDDFLAGQGVIDYAAGPIENTDDSSVVQIVRNGTVRVPVDIQVTLASGSQHIMHWDGQSKNTRFEFPADDPIQSVEIDPQRKLKAELYVLNNAISVEPQLDATASLAGQLVFALQVIVQTIGLFG